MLAFPPLQVMQVSAKGERGSFYSGDGNAIVDRVAAFRASAGLNELRRHGAMPGNSPVSALVQAGGIDGADGAARSGVPVLAIRPVVDQHGDAANLAKRQLAIVRRRISPDAAVTAIKSASATIVGSAIRHPCSPWTPSWLSEPAL